MRRKSVFGRAAISLLCLLVIMVIFIAWGRQPKRIPFDEKKALIHIRPYYELKGYIKAYQEFRMRSQGRMIVDTSLSPLAESFNRDAFAALLNAPGVANARVYIGLKPNKQFVFCILPVDAKGNDLRVNLVDRDKRSALHIPGISSAWAQRTLEPQGLEEGQRCPTLCSGE